MGINLSVVIPVFNEKGNIRPLIEKLVLCLEAWTDINSFEVLLVDDGSTDRSLEECESIKDSHVGVISCSHRGQSYATREGIDRCRFETIVTLDADLQNDPADIPAMFQTLEKGFDFVQGWRRDRKDTWIRKMTSAVANSLRRMMVGDSFHDSGCSLRLFKKECMDGINFFDGAHRVLPLLVQRQGYKVVELPVRHHPRLAGHSKYNIRNRLLKSFTILGRLKDFRRT